MKHRIILLFLSLMMVYCAKEPVETIYDFPDTAKGVFIACEGNFMYGNGTLSFYNHEKKIVSNKLFYARNNAPLGDVVQSLAMKDNRLFIVVNNSGKIVVADAATIGFTGVIGGLTSPRHIHFVNDEKAYVSDLYAPFITIFNPSTLEITGKIDLDNHTSEQMVQVGRYLYLTHWSYGNSILVIDTVNDSLVGQMEVPFQPRNLVSDRNGKIWVLSEGSPEGTAAGRSLPALTRVDTETFTIEQIYRFSEGTLPRDLKINNSGDTIWYLNNGVYKMSVNSRQLPETPFIGGGGKLFYSLAVDPRNHEVYVSDAIDYTQNALIYRYSNSGNLIDSFKVGINPSYFLFR